MPIELSKEKDKELEREYVNDNFVSQGMIADVGFHYNENKNELTDLTRNPISKVINKTKLLEIKKVITNSDYKLFLLGVREKDFEERKRNYVADVKLSAIIL